MKLEIAEEMENCMKNFLKVKVILPILIGIAIGTVLFILGDADDAPGLSFIGLLTAFLLTMRGIYHSGVIGRGYHIPIIFLVFGVIGIIFPAILFLDGEIEGLSVVTFIGWGVGTALLIAATMRIKSIKRKS